MSKKHFEAVAAELREALKDAREYGSAEGAAEIRGVVGRLARVFSGLNPRFDSARFSRACGVND